MSKNVIITQDTKLFHERRSSQETKATLKTGELQKAEHEAKHEKSGDFNPKDVL